MPRNLIAPSPGIRLFAVFVFILTSVPRLGMKVGPLPLYVIDFLIVLLMAIAVSRPGFPGGKRPFAMSILLLAAFAVAGEVAGSLTSGEIIEPVYVTGRTLLAFAVFYITSQIVRNVRDIEIVMKAGILGLIVTAMLMILTSLPMTRVAVTGAIFSNPFLEPAAEDVVELFSTFREGEGARGRTLVGVSIVGATFLNVLWPMAALLIRWPRPLGLWRIIAWGACLIAPMGVLMSYSRGPILGTILIVLAVLILGFSRVRRGVVLPVAAGVALVAMVGVSSQIFFFDRLANRTEAMFEAPTEAETESERILAYSEPFEHVASNPRFLIVGEGNAIRRANVVPEQDGKATHAVFAMGYYAYGMLGTLILCALIFRVMWFCFTSWMQAKGTVAELQYQALFLSMVAILPWAVFGHAIVSTPRGMMLFYLIIGLVAAVSRFPVRIINRDERPPIYVNGRRTAF